jgi:hypothetical protein
VPCHTLGKLFQLRIGHGALRKYFQMRCINEQNHYCECGQLETTEHVLKECPLHPAERDYLRKVSPELDTKKGLGVVVKFLDSLPQLFCWWFAWLEQLVEVLLSTNRWYQSTGCYVSQVSLDTWNYSWRIRRHRTVKYVLTLLPCQSHKDICFKIHVFFVCHIVL